jgi:hypothetical protein
VFGFGFFAFEERGRDGTGELQMKAASGLLS